MCDKSNAEEIVQEMLNYLETADYSIREEMVSLFQLFLEMAAKSAIWHATGSSDCDSSFLVRYQVLKVAILAEKYATDYTWYVDVILNLIRIAGEYVSDEVWFRVIQIVINREDVQGYAAKTVFEVPINALPKISFINDGRRRCRPCKLRPVTRTWSKSARTFWESLAT